MDSATLHAFLSVFVYQEAISALIFGVFVGGLVQRVSAQRTAAKGPASPMLVAAICGVVAMSVVSSYIVGGIWRLWALRGALAPHGLFGGVAGLIAVFLVFTAGSLIGASLDQWRRRRGKA